MTFTAEHEARFLDINVEEISSKIKLLGGRLIFSCLQKRHVFDIPESSEYTGWLRLRSNGHQTTLTLKRQTPSGVEELELGVDDFDKMMLLLEQLGMSPRAFHENFRTLYELPNKTAVSIDVWPGLQPFLEIEGPSMASVFETIALLGLSQADTSSLTIPEIYQAQGKPDILATDLRFSETELKLLLR